MTGTLAIFCLPQSFSGSIDHNAWDLRWLAGKQKSHTCSDAFRCPIPPDSVELVVAISCIDTCLHSVSDPCCCVDPFMVHVQPWSLIVGASLLEANSHDTVEHATVSA